MARPYRLAYPDWFDEPRVMRLTPAEKLVRVYCPVAQANRCGLFVFSAGMAAEHTGLPLGTRPPGFGEEPGRNPGGTLGGTLPPTPPERPAGVDPTFWACFAAVCGAMGWRYDAAARVLFLPEWWKDNPPQNANVLKGALGDLEKVPETPLRQAFFANTRHLGPGLAVLVTERRGNPGGTLPPTSPEPSPTQDQDQDQDQEHIPPSPHGGNGVLFSSDEPKTANAPKTPRPRRPRKSAPPEPEGFAEWYAAYPRKEDRAKAAAAFAALDPDAAMQARMLAAVAEQSRSAKWREEGGRYIPYPSTWISRRRWEDELRPAAGAAAAAAPPKTTHAQALANQ